MAATKQLSFYEQFSRVTVVMNGQPLSLNAEVFVNIKRPAKLDLPSRRAWDQLTPGSAQFISVDLASLGSEQE